MNSPPAGSWDVVTDSAIAGSDTSRIRAWARRVDVAGAQSVKFTTSPQQYDNHARLFVISGIAAGDAQPFTVVRAVNGIVKPHGAGTEVRLFRPAIRAL
jgi:hypothetical protein